MSLISAAEVNSIAFVTPITESQILPLFISTAEAKFILPLVTKALYDKITTTPSDYTILVNNYIKPYLAFSVKYMFYNQLLTETNTFPTSDEQRSAALQEVITIMEVNRDLLGEYLNATVFEHPVTTKIKMVSGFRTGESSLKSSSTTSSPVSETLSGASLGTLANEDTLNFIQFTTGLLKKISFSNFKIALKEYLIQVFPSLWLSEISFEFRNITPGTAQLFDLDIKASYSYSVISAILETDNGTLSGVSVKINSTSVASLSSVTVDTSADETTATASNSVVAGDRISIATSTGFSGSPTLLRGKLKILKS